MYILQSLAAVASRAFSPFRAFGNLSNPTLTVIQVAHEAEVEPAFQRGADVVVIENNDALHRDELFCFAEIFVRPDLTLDEIHGWIQIERSGRHYTAEQSFDRVVKELNRSGFTVQPQPLF